MVGKFIETEDKNFALFNYVNQLNNEIEMMQEQIADVEGNIERFKQDSVTADEQRGKILKDLQVRAVSTSQGSKTLICTVDST